MDFTKVAASMCVRRASQIAIVVACSMAWAGEIRLQIPTNEISVINSGGNALFSEELPRGVIGDPQLPLFKTSVLLPPETDMATVSCSVEGRTETVVPGSFEVSPTSPLGSINGLIWPEGVDPQSGKSLVYNTNAAYPQSSAVIAEVGLLDRFKLADIRVAQYRYNPVTKQLVQQSGGTLVVKYDETRDGVENSNYPIPEETLKRVQGMVSNFDSGSRGYSAHFSYSYAPRKLFVVLTSACEKELTELPAFITSKKNRGIEVVLIKEDKWGGGTGATGAANLRKWLVSNYQPLGIVDLLIIGNPTTSGDVPMLSDPYEWTSQFGNVSHDWGFAQLSGTSKSDTKVEINVGRIPVYGKYTETNQILKKIIAYESTLREDALWRKAVLGGAGGYDAGSKGDKPLLKLKSYLKADWKSYLIFGNQYGAPASGYDKLGISYDVFTSQWKSSPYGLVSWCTHGAPTYADVVFKNINALTVGNKYPSFVLMGSCYNAAPATTTNLSYSVLRDCGIGAFGGTNPTAYTPSGGLEGGTDESWAHWVGKIMITDSSEAGKTLTKLRDMTAGSGWYNLLTFVLYGDPTLGLYTYGEKTPIVQNGSAVGMFNPSVRVSSQNITVSLGGISSERVDITLYSLQGKLIRSLFSGIASSESITTSLESLAAGRYICNVVQGGKVASLPIVIK